MVIETSRLQKFEYVSNIKRSTDIFTDHGSWAVLCGNEFDI